MSASAAAYGAASATGTASIVRCSLPLPSSACISVIVTPSRAHARFFNPKLRDAGSSIHSASIVSNATGCTVSPWRASTT